MKLKSRKQSRTRRHRRVRRKISGTVERPRMAIMLSSRNMYVQFIDDDAGVTLASASSMKDEKRDIGAARELGKRASESAIEKGVNSVVVDRGGFKFHGRLKAIVDGAVEGGLIVGNTKKAPAEKGSGQEPDQDGDDK